MRFGDLNWMDVEEYLMKDDRVMVVLGSSEQHGYLSLQTDVRIPLALADAASQKSNVIVAPEITVGVTPYFLSYPGTISLRCETLLMVVEDVIRSLYGSGFRRIMILNGHGGNELARDKCVELANELDGLRIIWYAWWMSNSVSALAQKFDLPPEHANWMEAFNFTQVAELPQGSKTPVSYSGLLNASQSRQIYGDGTFGGPYSVDDQIMNELFDVCVQDILYFLEFPELPK